MRNLIIFLTFTLVVGSFVLTQGRVKNDGLSLNNKALAQFTLSEFSMFLGIVSNFRMCPVDERYLSGIDNLKKQLDLSLPSIVMGNAEDFPKLFVDGITGKEILFNTGFKWQDPIYINNQKTTGGPSELAAIVIVALWNKANYALSLEESLDFKNNLQACLSSRVRIWSGNSLKTQSDLLEVNGGRGTRFFLLNELGHSEITKSLNKHILCPNGPAVFRFRSLESQKDGVHKSGFYIQSFDVELNYECAERSHQADYKLFLYFEKLSRGFVPIDHVDMVPSL